MEGHLLDEYTFGAPGPPLEPGGCGLLQEVGPGVILKQLGAGNVVLSVSLENSVLCLDPGERSPMIGGHRL